MPKFPLRVMIVDDHPSFWEAAQWTLSQDSRFEVVAKVKRASEAIERLDHEAVDLILIGLRLPDASGIKTARRLRARHRNITVILVASDLQEEHRRQARRADIHACLLKDEFSVETLSQALTLPDVG